MLGLVKKVLKNKKSTEQLSGDSKTSSFKKGSCSDCCGCFDDCCGCC